MLLVICIIVIVILVVVLITNQKPEPGMKKLNNREGFGDILGALGDYDAQLAAAIDQTSQSDPSKRLQPWPAYNAGSYIQSYATTMRKAGIPPVKPTTITSKCKEQCKSDDPLASQKCTGMCYCYNNVKRACSIDCQYTDEPTKDCLRGCMANKLTNCNNFSWGFAEH